jgi:hypothetical protein
MKKLVSLLSVCMLATSAFALDFGVGVNGGMSSSALHATTSIFAVTTDTVTKYKDLGFEAFLTTDYVQFGMGYLSRGNNGSTITIGGTPNDYPKTDEKYSSIPLEILFRYPLSLGKLKVIPMAGFEYDLCVGGTKANGDAIASSDLADYNRLTAKLGLGFDIPLSRKLSLRPQALCGFGLYNQKESDTATSQKSGIYETWSYFDFSLTGGLFLAYKL